MAWLFLGEVSVIAAAHDARLESNAYVHSVESAVSGRVVAVQAGLGARVAAGELLVRIETEHQEHELKQARGLLGSWHKRLDASLSARARLLQAAQESKYLTVSQLEEIEARRSVDLVTFEYARKRVERSEKLFGLGLVSEVDLLHHQGDAEKAEAEARVRQAEASALEAEARRDAITHAAELTHVERDIGEAGGEIDALLARIELLEHEIEDRHVLAPVAGVVGWLAPLRPGAVATTGDRLAEIVPQESVRVVGQFPRSAVGRLKIGQPARFRLDALPWTRYGSIDLEIERLEIESEAENGMMRVELALTESPHLPLTHGMTGRLEVVVERVSPARWLLQVIGRAGPRPRD